MGGLSSAEFDACEHLIKLLETEGAPGGPGGRKSATAGYGSGRKSQMGKVPCKGLAPP